MRRKRVYSDIDKNLCAAAEAKSKKLGISRAKLIEIALKSRTRTFQRPQREQTPHRSEKQSRAGNRNTPSTTDDC